MATAVWKGLLRFGLLSIPVKLYRAGQAEKISFRQLHKTNGARVGQQRSPDADHIVAASLVKDTVGNSARGEELNSASIPKLNGRAILDTAPLKSEDLIKGYEFEKGSYVRFSREELARVAPATAKEIELCEFVQAAEIDVLLIESSFFVAPNWGSEQPYGILFEALRRSGLAGVCQVTMHSRESVVVFRAHDRGLIAQTLFYEPEIRREVQYRARGQVREQEVKLALRLIQETTVQFDALKYYDRYRDSVEAVIRAKVSGRQLTTANGEDDTSLLQALKSSLQATVHHALAAEDTRQRPSPGRKARNRDRAAS